MCSILYSLNSSSRISFLFLTKSERIFFLSILYDVCYRVSDWELYVLFLSPTEAETEY
jgi:hypothetical protein